jgi:hypothetical protein
MNECLNWVRYLRSTAHTHCLILGAAFATAGAIAPSFAKTIDQKTSCSVAIRAFDSGKRAGQVLAGAPSPEVAEVGDYILDVMERLDRRHTNEGEPSIWSTLSETGRHALAASAVANCRLHPGRTIYNAADFVYHSVRDIQIQLGISK